MIRLLAGATIVLAVAGADARTIQSQVDRLLRGRDLGKTRVALQIVDLRSGATLAQVKPDQLMIPASNMKLVTTAAALATFGRDFKFQTQLRLIVEPDWKTPDKQLETVSGAAGGRALLIRGDGDPGFCDPNLLEDHGTNVDELVGQWVKAVVKTGLKEFDRIIVDDRVFDQQFVHDGWPRDQLNRHYCAQVAGLNFHTNVLHAHPQPTEPGQTPRVLLRPEGVNVETTNRAVTGTTDTFGVDRRANMNHLVFSGRIAHYKGVPYRVTMHDPPLLFADLLKRRLAKEGITVKTVERVGPGQTLPDGRLIYTVRTTLFEVMRRSNSESVNLYAESLLKRLGRRFTGTSGGWGNGSAAVREFLLRRFGPGAAIVNISDGSGLSRENLVTPQIIVKLLRSMYEDKALGVDYIESLAVGGVRGTLKKRFTGQLKGKIYAKTGHINRVSCLSGYFFTPADDNEYHAVAFCLMFNDIREPVPISRAKAVQDDIVRLIAASYGLKMVKR